MNRKKDHPEYRSWTNMKLRTTNPRHEGFKNYGGRGIKVCDEWLGRDGFWKFIAYVGPKPSLEHSIDRYPNNDGNYEPGNVRWATRKEQAENSRPPETRIGPEPDLITFNGRSLSLYGWSKETGLKIKTLRKRLNYLGWSVEKALSTQARSKSDVPF